MRRVQSPSTFVVRGFPQRIFIQINFFVGWVRSQKAPPRSSSCMRRSCTKVLSTPTRETCRMFSDEWAFKCPGEWQSPERCCSFTSEFRCHHFFTFDWLTKPSFQNRSSSCLLAVCQSKFQRPCELHEQERKLAHNDHPAGYRLRFSYISGTRRIPGLQIMAAEAIQPVLATLRSVCCCRCRQLR